MFIHFYRLYIPTNLVDLRTKLNRVRHLGFELDPVLSAPKNFGRQIERMIVNVQL